MTRYGCGDTDDQKYQTSLISTSFIQLISWILLMILHRSRDVFSDLLICNNISHNNKNTTKLAKDSYGISTRNTFLV